MCWLIVSSSMLKAQDVGQQHDLLTGRAGDLAHPLDEIHCGEPLVAGQPHVAREIMQVLHQADEQLPEALVGGVVEGPLNGFGDRLFGQIARHVCLSA